MRKSTKEYKAFIDGLVKIREGVLSSWVKEKGWPKLPENEEINLLLEKLSPDQKRVVAAIVERAREGGIHDTLVYLNDRIVIDGLRMVRNGVELAVQPFDTEMYYDWVCRSSGDPWPDEKK